VARDDNVLAIDTASSSPAVALLARGRIFEETLAPDRRASEELLPAIRRCLSSAGLSIGELSLLAVCAGPGSFTGIRVGLATAWGLARAAGVPVETVSTLEAIAEASRDGEASGVWAAVDAGRGDVAVQPFRLSPGRADPRGEPRLVAAERAAGLAEGESLVAARGDRVPGAGPPLAITPARAVATAAAREPRGAAVSPARPLRAVYARPSAAEEKHGAA